MSVCNKPEKDLSYKMLNEKKTNVKCVIVGDAMVGKTSLARRLACLGFATDYNPTTFDNYVVRSGFRFTSELTNTTAVTQCTEAIRL
ncbi:hypothetical protein RRG08_054389 [Elysia crispata]|uniref:Uncharacterized protein n=1 Tax=Elysia crispata TaxID=231223 RepID=A0AAE1B4C3_9GAST|nr:hypothetical protein RRG08_054389 [Elysia crispata]